MTSSSSASTPSVTGSEERRQHVRIVFHTHAHLRSGDWQSEVEVLDISFKGALLRLPT